MTVTGQRDLILEAEQKLDVGPVELAKRLNTPYQTLKDWKAERARMPGIVYVAIDCLIHDEWCQNHTKGVDADGQPID